jgi:hypothetical protein
MLVRIVEAQPRGGSRLYLRFDDGAEGEVDIARVVSFEGVFAALRDPTFFARVAVDEAWGAIRWPNDVDLAPEPLYEQITGRCPTARPQARSPRPG